MRLLPTRSCQPGMKLAKPIFNEEGVVLLGKEVELSQNLIKRLQQLGIDYVYIHDPDTADLVISDPISDETRIRALKEIRGSFTKVLEETSTSKFTRNQQLGKTFTAIMQMLIDDLNSRENTVLMLMNMNILNNYLYSHSLNVCIYATMLGMVNGYSKNDLVTLGLGSLMHDIGKTKINLDLLKKPEKLTPEEFKELQKHTEHGFRLMKDEPNIPLLAAHCALSHHERIDGSGYPRGIKGNEIHDYAKWIAIADSYDAMTTHRAYRHAMLPHQAMEILFAGVETLYEQKKVASFRDNVAIYPLGLTVTLSTGEQGVVVGIDPASPQRPVIRVLLDPDGQKITQNYDVDLTRKLTVFVQKVNEL